VIALRWVRRREKDTKDLNVLLDRTEGKLPEAESQQGVDLESIAILMETYWFHGIGLHPVGQTSAGLAANLAVPPSRFA
jgi:hypothetical protein